ncbi:MAG: hypothetical protein VKN33_03715 [Candidatus Sericytochromatia bacterium]|nr:hypothetical protein [Candidatus Sericytochromatia bacterium]
MRLCVGAVIFGFGATGCALWDLSRDQVLGEVLSQPTPEPGSTTSPLPRRTIRTKFGPEIKFIANERFQGALYGFRSVRFLTFLKSVYVGGTAYGSLPLPGSYGYDLAPLFGYAGILAGYEKRFPLLTSDTVVPDWLGFSGRSTPWLGFDANLHVGLTQDLANYGPNPLGQNWSIEPSLSLSVPTPFFRGGRLAISGGYLFLPFEPSYSGWTIGLRFEGKLIETRQLVDE